MLSRAMFVTAIALIILACSAKKKIPPVQAKDAATPKPTADLVSVRPKPISDPTPRPVKPLAAPNKPVRPGPVSKPGIKPEPSPTPPANCKLQLADQITKLAPYRYRINAALFGVPDFSSRFAARGARFIPYYKLSRFAGMRLAYVRRGSVYELAGLQRGDVITRINGKPLNEVNAVLKYATTFGQGKSGRIRVTRGLKEIELFYELFRDPGKLCVANNRPGPANCRLGLHIQTVGKQHFKVSRALLKSVDRLFKHPSQMARMIPIYRIGQPAGVKLVGMSPGSFWSQLGVRNGDVITQFAGKTPASGSDLKEIFTLVSVKGRLTIVVDHRGKSKLIEIEAGTKKPTTLCLP